MEVELEAGAGYTVVDIEAMADNDQVRVPYGDFPFNREYDHDGTTALGVVRLVRGGTLVDLGAGVALLDETRPMVSASLGTDLYRGLSVWVRAGATLTGQLAAPVGVALSHALSTGSDGGLRSARHRVRPDGGVAPPCRTPHLPSSG